MKTIFLILGIAFILSCPSKGGEDWFWARITYYTGKQTACGAKPVQGDTVAAERAFKFGQRFYIPDLKDKIGGDGSFVVHDRGPDVQKRKASRGKLPVVDIYVSSSKQVKELARHKDNIFKVYKIEK